MQCGYKFCKEKTGEGAKEICDHNFIKDNGEKKRLEVQAIFPPAQQQVKPWNHGMPVFILKGDV